MTAARPLPARPQAKRPEHGFTLVELMVALTIGLLILLGLSVLFARNSGHMGEVEKVARQMENGRYALDTLSSELRHAGYYGEFNPDNVGSLTWTTPDPCATTIATMGWLTALGNMQIPVAITGTSGDTSRGCLPNRRADTAAVTVRFVNTGDELPRSAATATNLYAQVSSCNTDTVPVLVGSVPATFTLRNLACNAELDVIRRFITRTYYVASCNDCSPNDGIPTLKRVEFVNGELKITSIAEGVENLQLEYGLDTDNDGVVDEYLLPEQVNGSGTRLWRNAIAARLHLLARNTETTPGYTDPRTYTLGPGVTVRPADAFKRTLLTATLRLENVAARREQ